MTQQWDQSEPGLEMSSFNHCHSDFVVRKQSGCQTRSFTAFGSSRMERAASLAGTHRSWGWAGGQDREWERARSLWGVQEAGAALGRGRREAKEQSSAECGPLQGGTTPVSTFLLLHQLPVCSWPFIPSFCWLLFLYVHLQQERTFLFNDSPYILSLLSFW